MSPIPLGILAAAGGAPAGAYELISTQVLASSAASVTFSSIPQDYKHLQIRISARVTTDDYVAKLNFNSDTGANYAFHRLIGNGSSVASSASASQAFIWTAIYRSVANQFTAEVIDILDYSSANKNTTTRHLGGLATDQVQLNSGLWNNTAAVTAINLSGYSDWVTGSRFSLYGIRG
jgi:hypothetical protein